MTLDLYSAIFKPTSKQSHASAHWLSWLDNFRKKVHKTVLITWTIYNWHVRYTV